MIECLNKDFFNSQQGFNMKKFLAFLVFVAILGGGLFGAYHLVPASVTVKVFDETYTAATPKGAEALDYQVGNIVNTVTKAAKEVGKELEKATEKSPDKDIIPELKNKVNEALPEDAEKALKDAFKNVDFSNLKFDNISVSFDGAEPRKLSESEQQKLMELLKNGDFKKAQEFMSK